MYSATRRPGKRLFEAQEETCVLLESVIEAKNGPDIHLFCVDPVLTNRPRQKGRSRRGRSRVSVAADDPLTIVKDILDQFNPVELPELPRFSGGFVGYLAYDIVRSFETLPFRKKPGSTCPICC